jgi:hypothetical protein
MKDISEAIIPKLSLTLSKIDYLERRLRTFIRHRWRAGGHEYFFAGVKI